MVHSAVDFPRDTTEVMESGFVFRSLRSPLRKEVIQPQVLLRLPCYDLVPITELAVDGSLHCWLGYRLRALPALVA